jgi:hypothetical protein
VYRAREGSMGRCSLADAAGPLRRDESDGTGGEDASSNWRSPPRPAAKAAEHALSYNQGTWEVDGRRGWRRSPE